MNTPEVVIVDTGCANLASVRAALARASCPAVASSCPDRVANARAVVLPGVGHFAAGRERLRQTGLDRAIVWRINEGSPLLAICLGMQLLLEGSEEAPGVAGLGLIPGVATRMQATAVERVPQMGWNRIEPQGVARLLEPGWFYFANTYRLAERQPDGSRPDAGWAVADHAGPLVAAIEDGNLLACQFHPELSGAAGKRLIGRWLALALAGEPQPC